MTTLFVLERTVSSW